MVTSRRKSRHERSKTRPDFTGTPGFTHDAALEALAANDAAGIPKKKPLARVQFDHEMLRKALKENRKSLKLNIKYAAESCGIPAPRLSKLERGYAESRERVVKFNIHEVMGICMAFGLDIWSFTILPQLPEGTASQQRDRAWAEAQQAWQQTAELTQLLRRACAGRLTVNDKARVKAYCGPFRTWRISDPKPEME